MQRKSATMSSHSQYDLAARLQAAHCIPRSADFYTLAWNVRGNTMNKTRRTSKRLDYPIRRGSNGWLHWAKYSARPSSTRRPVWAWLSGCDTKYEYHSYIQVQRHQEQAASPLVRRFDVNTDREFDSLVGDMESSYGVWKYVLSLIITPMYSVKLICRRCYRVGEGSYVGC